MLKWKEREAKVTGKMREVDFIIRDEVYVIPDGNIYIDVNDASVAVENNRVYVKYLDDFKMRFYGDTYNQKEEIKELAQKYETKAKFERRRNSHDSHWLIDTEEIENDEDLVSFLKEVLEKYDYSFKTAQLIREDIEEFA